VLELWKNVRELPPTVAGQRRIEYREVLPVDSIEQARKLAKGASWLFDTETGEVEKIA